MRLTNVSHQNARMICPGFDATTGVLNSDIPTIEVDGERVRVMFARELLGPSISPRRPVIVNCTFAVTFQERMALE